MSVDGGAVSSKAAAEGPLAGWKIAIIGETKTPRAALTKSIMELGASVVTSIDKKTALSISTEGLCTLCVFLGKILKKILRSLYVYEYSY